ncbi:hypothetical protein ACN9MZ_09645 [Pseudoduganella sp. S-14]|uniref:hypothetical protein n=1 Tax=Pseudoduganella sp. S-14 TaxID=3404065 RepID=UPI003CF95CF7
MRQDIQPCVRLSARLFGSLLLAVTAGFAAAEPCRKISTDAELSSYTQVQGTQATIARDICYAEGTEWDEKSPAGAYDVTLDQRFDFYRPASLPAAQRLPLIIWAHPNGMTDNLPQQGDLYPKLVTPALALGFAFMSVEFRHPVASQRYGLPPNLDIPNTDIARAVQWARHRSGMLGIDGSNIFIVGQSRGTLGLMNAFSKNLADDQSPFPYQIKSSRVRAVYAVQAQTTYEREQVKQTFIHPDSWAAFEQLYANFHQPGSAINEITTDDPPVAMRYERMPTDQSLQTVVPLHLPAQNGSCAYPEGCFDFHHPNFGLKLHLAFKALSSSQPASKFDIAYNVPTEYLYVDQTTNRPYACFFAKNLTPEGRATLSSYAVEACGL